MASFIFEEVGFDAVRPLVMKHLHSLSVPVESWTEENLLTARFLMIRVDGVDAGYAAYRDDTLRFFFVLRAYFRYAPDIFERLTEEKGLNHVFALTQDVGIQAILAEWDYEKVMVACLFTDSGEGEVRACLSDSATFRTAEMRDVSRIRQATGDFFDLPEEGYAGLEERVAAGILHILEEGEDVLGCGITLQSRLTPEWAGIGMMVNPAFRRRGAGRKLILHLKERVYEDGMKPNAGCWYYNTLSRRTLESAGMAVTALCFEAVLRKREKPPLRTGNPPGELVE